MKSCSSYDSLNSVVAAFEIEMKSYNKEYRGFLTQHHYHMGVWFYTAKPLTFVTELSFQCTVLFI